MRKGYKVGLVTSTRRRSSILLLGFLCSSSIFPSSSATTAAEAFVAQQEPEDSSSSEESFVEESILWAGLEDPDAILLKEIEWAQKSMERYRQTTGAYPLRSFDNKKDDIFSNDWVQESLTSLRLQEEESNHYGTTTRGSRKKTSQSRFLRGSGDGPRPRG